MLLHMKRGACLQGAAFTDIKNSLSTLRLKGTLLFTQNTRRPLRYRWPSLVHICLLCVFVLCDFLGGAGRWVTPALMQVAVRGIYSDDALLCDLQIDSLIEVAAVKCQLFRKSKQLTNHEFQILSHLIIKGDLLRSHRRKTIIWDWSLALTTLKWHICVGLHNYLQKNPNYGISNSIKTTNNHCRNRKTCLFTTKQS